VNVLEFYRQIYYEAIDTVVVAINNHFMQEDFIICKKAGTTFTSSYKERLHQCMYNERCGFLSG